MRLLLFQLITGFTIGSTVAFKGMHSSTYNIYWIVDVQIHHLFNRQKSGLFKATWRRPLWFMVTMSSYKTGYGGIEIVGHRALKSIYDAGLTYHDIESHLQR